MCGWQLAKDSYHPALTPIENFVLIIIPLRNIPCTIILSVKSLIETTCTIILSVKCFIWGYLFHCLNSICGKRKSVFLRLKHMLCIEEPLSQSHRQDYTFIDCFSSSLHVVMILCPDLTSSSIISLCLRISMVNVCDVPKKDFLKTRKKSDWVTENNSAKQLKITLY